MLEVVFECYILYLLLFDQFPISIDMFTSSPCYDVMSVLGPILPFALHKEKSESPFLTRSLECLQDPQQEKNCDIYT